MKSFFWITRPPLRLVLAILFLAGTPWSLAQKNDLPSLPASTQTALQAVLDDAVNTQKMFPGIVFAISKPGFRTWTGASGFANIQNQEKIDKDDAFRAGSITKTFTSMLALRMVQDPQYPISLDSTLDKMLPGVLDKYETGKITLRMLLQHTSGIYNYTKNCDFQDKYKNFPLKTPFSNQDLLNLANTHGPIAKPGEKFEYSNTNYLLLALILEKLSGQSYPDLVNKYILAHSQINLPSTHSPEVGDLDLPNHHAEGYINWFEHSKRSSCQYTGPKPDELLLWTRLDPEYAWSAGNIISNSDDLTRWIRLVGSGVLLNKDLFEEQCKGVKMNPIVDYGLGIMLITNMFGHKEVIIGHEGEIAGYEAFAGYIRELNGRTDGTVMVQLINRTQDDPNARRQPTFRKMIDVVYASPAETKKH